MSTLLEKYKPKTIEELKLPNRLYTLIMENMTKKGWRLLLFGTPGTGKTTTARLMSMGHDVLYLSGSNDFNIEVLRTKIYPFCSEHSILGKQKTIIIDEAENMRNNIQDAFKITLDRSTNVNFIFITNEVEKMNDAVKSRCTNIEYNFQHHEHKEQQNNFVMFAKRICDEEKLDYDNSGLSELYKLNYPDFRHLIVNMQQLVDSKQKITRENVKNMSENGIQNVPLYELLNEIDSQKFFMGATEFKGNERECLISLGEPYFSYLNSQGKFEQTIKAASIVAKYCNMHVNAFNKFTCFFACLTELRAISR